MPRHRRAVAWYDFMNTLWTLGCWQVNYWGLGTELCCLRIVFVFLSVHMWAVESGRCHFGSTFCARSIAPFSKFPSFKIKAHDAFYPTSIFDIRGRVVAQFLSQSDVVSFDLGRSQTSEAWLFYKKKKKMWRKAVALTPPNQNVSSAFWRGD